MRSTMTYYGKEIIAVFHTSRKPQKYANFTMLNTHYQLFHRSFPIPPFPETSSHPSRTVGCNAMRSFPVSGSFSSTRTISERLFTPTCVHRSRPRRPRSRPRDNARQCMSPLHVNCYNHTAQTSVDMPVRD